jgi:3-deoxy-D-manno-octulosonic acid kinase
LNQASESRRSPPAGYVTGRERGARVVALPSVFEDVVRAVREHGTLHEAAAAQPAGASFSGRGAAHLMKLGGEQAVVRHYRRGGAMAGVLGDRYLRAGRPRPARELEASVGARLRGVATPEVLATVTYAAAAWYRADIATRYVPATRDLATAVLSEARADAAARLRLWRAAGDLLGHAFNAGVEHPDLNLRNVLVSDDARAFLIDLDRALVRDRPVSGAARAAMVERLHRSRRKLETRYGSKASAEELAAFDEAVGAS